MFTVNEELSDRYAISVCITLKALESVTVNKATGHENIPAWMLRKHATIFALTAIFNKSLREGILPMERKIANGIPLPKTNPHVSIDKDIIPISRIPIAAKVFEYNIIMMLVDEAIDGLI